MSRIYDNYLKSFINLNYTLKRPQNEFIIHDPLTLNKMLFTYLGIKFEKVFWP